MVREAKLLAVFVSPKEKADVEFRQFLKVGHRLMHLQDVDFAYLYIETFGKDLGSYRNFIESPFYKSHEYGIRVYRRGNMGDIKDFDSEDTSTEGMERFILRSTFVGEGPDFIRKLDTENTMKFFS